MKLTLVSVGLLAVLLGSMAERAAFLVDNAEVSEKICPKNLCLNHWDKVTAIMCDKSTGRETASKDYVFGSYVIGQTTCLCPLQFYQVLSLTPNRRKITLETYYGRY